MFYISIFQTGERMAYIQYLQHDKEGQFLTFLPPLLGQLLCLLFYHAIMVTYSGRTEILKLSIRNREGSLEMFVYDSIKGFFTHDFFGLPKKASHRPHVRSFPGNSDPRGIDAEFSTTFLIRYISSSFI